ncbi:MAG: hypothetical protein WDO16_10005 [Bacteroidota bacterium]
MKKIFTLIAAAFLTVAVFAADRKPVVSLKASRAYEVIIDGQSYFSSNSSMSLANIRSGQHSIKVYEVNTSRFRKLKKLVSASSFQVKKNDVAISINTFGQISITEDKFDRDRRDDRKDNDWDKKDSRDKDHGNNKNDRDKRF